MLARSDVLHTERLLLRPCQTGDMDVFAATWGDPDVMATFGPGAPIPQDRLREHPDNYINGHAAGRVLAWTVELAFSQDKVGFVYLRWEDEDSHTLSIGFLMRREHQGNGYATEGARAAVDFAMRELNPYQVIATVMRDNAASIRVLDKANFVYSHDIREWARCLYAITNPDRADE